MNAAGPCSSRPARLGHAIRTIHDTEGKALEASDVKFDVVVPVRGRSQGERMRLFMIYSAGTSSSARPIRHYLQIGEHKYGKPVLDRAISYEMDLYDALSRLVRSIPRCART